MVSVGAVVFFVYYVAIYSVNFPFQDDNTFLQLITEIRKGLSWPETISTFFRADNDHRIFVPRFVSYIDYLINGHLNFRSYIFIAAINLIFVAGYIYGLFRQLKLPLAYFLPIPLLIFQPQYHEVTIWALTGLQHITLLLLLCACLILLQEPSPVRVATAVFLALLATYTHGNGILVFATGFFILLINRHYVVLLPWMLAMMIALAGYLAGYTPGSGVKSSIDWPLIPAAFVAKIGATLSTWPSLSIGAPIIWGTLICIVVIPSMLMAVYQSLRKNSTQPAVAHTIFAFFCFIFLTTGLITIYRASSEIVLENRFKIYAAFSSVFFYLFLLITYPKLRRGTYVFFVVFATLFYLSSYSLYTPEVVNKYTRYVADTYNWRKNQTELCNFSSIESSIEFLVPAYQQGYWQVPERFADFDERLKATIRQNRFKPLVFQTKHYLHEGNGPPQLLIETPEFPLRRRQLRDELFVVLHDETTQRTYLTGTLPKMAGWRRLLTEGVYFGNGFSTTVPLKATQPGQYRLGCLLKEAGGKSELIMTQQTVTL
ncbi:hypothetical protein DUE52_27520 [Larkinella punicea]|uniref:Glycosyltransferase RgtA/B/C/D-like domain-containing protein n=1 Tax=Larkinella punicea TaxID=2315727 RepID=A0A368JF57_9BACT|nr:hypothetical protein DUE52_27520 [Larkinella punicea]